MEKKDKRILIYIAFAMLLFTVAMHLDYVAKGVQYILGLIAPIAAGLILAFVLNVPVNGFTNLLEKSRKDRSPKLGKNAIHRISVWLSLISVTLVLVLLCVLVIPRITEAVKSIFKLMEMNWPGWVETLGEYGAYTPELKDWLMKLNWNDVFHKSADYASVVIGTISDVASSTVSVIYIAGIAIIIAIYTLFDRNKLAVQAKSMLYAYAKNNVADQIMYVCGLIKTAYTKFLTTQCIEAVILGTLIAIAFAVFRFPYALLVGAVTAICALIPYIGAFISCALGVVLTLMVAPQRALLCLIVYLAVQFIEGHFIYPRVVGSSVGLSPLWTLAAVLIGGKLFGLIGMIFFIPLVSVIYLLLKEDVEKRLNAK